MRKKFALGFLVGALANVLALTPVGAPAAEPDFEDRTFLLSAMGASLAQVRVSELAAEKARDGRVRELARRLLDYHRRSNERLVRAAGRYGIEPLPGLDPVAQRWLGRLQRAEGPQFDAGYVGGEVVWLYTARYGYRRQALFGSDDRLRREAARQLEDADEQRHAAQRIAASLRPPAAPVAAPPAAPPAPGLHTEDRTFLVYAIDGDLTELRLAELGAEKARDERVRGFARHMLEYHRASLDKLLPIARENGIEPWQDIGPIGQRTLERLRQLDGPRFDWEYIANMVVRHYSAHYRYEREAIHGRNEPLRAIGEKGAKDTKEQHEAARKVVREWDEGGSQAMAALPAPAAGGAVRPSHEGMP